MQLIHLDSVYECSIFVLMMLGHPLSVNLPEDLDLGERFWYWRGASGRSYIHSIYRRDLCPVVPGAVFVLVQVRDGSRRALSAGRFATEPMANTTARPAGHRDEEEIHVHLLARSDACASLVLGDLLAAINAVSQPVPEPPLHARPVQLDLLAA
jgi:hypothetical protein